ncbi:MAG: class I SAM-dependent methyltransferase [Phycisphaerae bacterium]|nr:class I SAM-dependent methyltransferase [Phycisphaerae bacterium]
MRVTTDFPPASARTFGILNADRSTWAAHFARVISSDARTKGRVLDVGCGRSGPTTPQLNAMERDFGPIDGVDPSEEIHLNPYVREKWVGEFESAPIPAGVYDIVLSVFVVEHVRDGRAHLQAAFRALKPGGALYAATPHLNHPFPYIVKTFQMLGLKDKVPDEGDKKINTYPAYYRLNSARQVLAAAEGLGFTEAAFYYYPCLMWDWYWPRPLRFLPHAYDWALGRNFQSLAQMFMFKLEKPNTA